VHNFSVQFGVSPHRVLKYFNIAVGVALVAAVFTVYWLAWRPLPKVSGSVAAPVSGRIMVRRDALGTPHIQAGSVEEGREDARRGVTNLMEMKIPEWLGSAVHFKTAKQSPPPKGSPRGLHDSRSMRGGRLS